MDVSKKLPQLDELLQYTNPQVIQSFVSTFGVTDEDAEKIFKEMLRFFWLSSYSDDRELSAIDTSQTVIDEMWHTFILHTIDYGEFCLKYFGQFIHHRPSTSEEIARSNAERNADGGLAFKEKKKRKYEKIFDILGQDVFITWFFDFPARFSKRTLLEMRKR